MSSEILKDAARHLIERLPDATWEDLQYEIYIRQAIESGLKDSIDGRTVPQAEARKRFGLDPV